MSGAASDAPANAMAALSDRATLTLRPARTADIPVLAALLVQLYHVDLPGGLRGPLDAQQALVRYMLEQASGALFRRYVVVDAADRPLATASLRHDYDRGLRAMPVGTTRLAWRRLGPLNTSRLLVSLLRAGLAPDLALGRRTALLHSVVVDAPLHGQGIGLWLISAIEPVARAGGAHTMQLRVAVWNAPAQRIYRRAGYRVVGRTPHWLDPLTFPSEVMQKPLAEA